MDMNNVDLEYLLGTHVLSIEYAAQYEFEHQISVEASAAQSESTQKQLQELYDKARVRVDISGSTISVDMYYVSIPKGMEDYAEMIRENAKSMFTPILRNIVSDEMSLDDVRQRLAEYCKEAITNQIRTALGGISQ